MPVIVDLGAEEEKGGDKPAPPSPPTPTPLNRGKMYMFD